MEQRIRILEKHVEELFKIVQELREIKHEKQNKTSHVSSYDIDDHSMFHLQ